jgi:hypothetical protein
MRQADWPPKGRLTRSEIRPRYFSQLKFLNALR